MLTSVSKIQTRLVDLRCLTWFPWQTEQADNTDEKIEKEG